MQGYTLCNVVGEPVKEFWAKNDSCAMLMAMAMAEEMGFNHYMLYRSGRHGFRIRKVAEINNTTSC